MMSLFSGYREGSLGSQRKGLPYYLYHYTTSDAAAQIFESGKLLPSIKENGDAKAGDGVYFTSIPPWAPRDTVIDNNYNGAGRYHNESRAEAYIRIEAWMLSPDVQVMRANVQQNSKGPMKGKVRDVYLVPGKEALDLSKSSETLLVTEPQAWYKSNARQEFIQVEMDMERKLEDQRAKLREIQKATYDNMSEETPWMDFSEEYAGLAEEEREAQLRLQRSEDERCLDGCRHRNFVYQQQRGVFRWELEQARRRGRSKTK